VAEPGEGDARILAISSWSLTANCMYSIRVFTASSSAVGERAVGVITMPPVNTNECSILYVVHVTRRSVGPSPSADAPQGLRSTPAAPLSGTAVPCPPEVDGRRELPPARCTSPPGHPRVGQLVRHLAPLQLLDHRVRLADPALPHRKKPGRPPAGDAAVEVAHHLELLLQRGEELLVAGDRIGGWGLVGGPFAGSGRRHLAAALTRT